MSNSELSRREVLRNVALAVAAGGMATSAEAQHVHEMAAAEKVASGGVYKPKLFQDHEYATLKHLCELTIPGANQGGAPEFIDLLASNNTELATLYTGGLGWLDAESQRRYKGAAFLDAKPEDQTALLDLIAYRRNANQEGLGHGVRFFDWLRRMTADAYYTSAPGIKEIGYKGNTAVAKFEVPQEAVEYALKRSALG